MLKFEIVSSRTVEGPESDKKFVAYMLQVRQDNKESRLFDPDPANVERRYTHFLDLYNGLKKDHAGLLSGIVFPRKVHLCVVCLANYPVVLRKNLINFYFPVFSQT